MHQIKTICVCGAGTMGMGIAQIAVQSGYRTILFDLNKETLEKTAHAIHENWASLAEKKKLSESALIECKTNLSFTSDINACKADLIIEAIIEKLSAKVDLFRQLAELNPINSIFVSNTSSISINLLASKMEDPFRFAGMHFFNPATHMKLVELVRSNFSSDALIKLLQELVTKMGKTAVICNDSPGFIVNRVARHFYLESLLMLAKGETNVATIDAVLESTGFKMGPFKLMDLIGIDINYSVSNLVWEALDQPIRLTPSVIQAEKIQQNELGRKTGKGFYAYPKK